MENSHPEIQNAVDTLYNWVLENGYSGWDIYDGLNSRFTQKISNSYLQILLLQINKYSPINMRDAVGIEKGIDLKGMALFAQAYAILFNITNDNKYMEEMKRTIDFIKSKSLKEKYGYDCWSSHYFPYVTLGKSTLAADHPDIIGTGQVIVAFINSYNITKDVEAKEMALSASDFIAKEFYQDDETYPFFAYTKTDAKPKHITLNASAQAMEALCASFSLRENEDYRLICERTARTLVHTQKSDGSWDYTIYKDGTKKRSQLDFHQGYIIDGLLAFYPYTDSKEEIMNCIKKATEFYRRVQFKEDGRSYFRYPMFYPADIHNQSQGIITFSKLSEFDAEYATFAKKVAIWTLYNMQDRSGYFYYQKWPFITNKIPHMRWGQAWMMLALSVLLEKVNDN